MFYTFDLHIPHDELLKFYAGAARQVHAKDRRGVRVSFPAQALRPFVTQEGITGVFQLKVDRDGRLLQVAKLSQT